jgi:hypothetical protein
VRLINTYGPIETTVVATMCELSGAEEGGSYEVPIGRAVRDVQTHILNERLQPVPSGLPGELYIGGAGLARGYLKRPELTAEKFIPHPFSAEPGARLYRTGDLVRSRPDGALEFVGRVDHQVKIRGFRIEPGEIDAVLSQHPAVRQVVVVAREDRPGERRLVAYVVPRQELAPTVNELRRFLQAQLPDYMLPSSFVWLDTLPLTPNGKVDRQALPAPGLDRPDTAKAFTAPRDVLELQLTRLWEQILNVKPIGVRDNFFELGGNSLLALRLFTAIDKLLRKKLSLAVLFQAPTVEHLADLLRRQNASEPSSLVVVHPGGTKSPFFCVHGYNGYAHLASYLGPDNPLQGSSKLL